MGEQLTLKIFQEEDIDLLFEWVNEEGCRKNSFNPEPIDYETHVNWCLDKITSEEVDIFIVYLQNIPVAQLRFLYEKHKALISYSIDKNYRGMGLGYRVIKLIDQEACYKDTCKTLIGKVKKDNLPSQKIFERCGYTKKIEYDHYIYIKDISL